MDIKNAASLAAAEFIQVAAMAQKFIASSEKNNQKEVDWSKVKVDTPVLVRSCEEEVDIYTAEQFREDIKLLEKMCEHTVCSDCRFNSQSCDTFCMDLNTLRAWAEAERKKVWK